LRGEFSSYHEIITPSLGGGELGSSLSSIILQGSLFLELEISWEGFRQRRSQRSKMESFRTMTGSSLRGHKG
jgi:hypothetical protein